MPRGLETLSRAARAELKQCAEEGLTSHKTRLRLGAHGAMVSERSVCRLMGKMRAELRRVSDLEAIGRGLGAVQIGATGAAEILRASAPGWRETQARILRDLLQQFLGAPTGELYCGLVVGMHAFLLGGKLQEALERSDA